MQKQAELSKERDKLNAFIQEVKVANEEAKQLYVSKPNSNFLILRDDSGGQLVCAHSRRRKQACAAYQVDLEAQMKQQRQLRNEQKAQAATEDQQVLYPRQLYHLSKPKSTNTVSHPFRRTGGSSSTSTHFPAPSTRHYSDVFQVQKY